MSTEGKDLQIISYEGKALECIDELVQLDAICFDENETWTEKNFMLDLPQKGQLSKLAILNNKLIGYVICSSYLNQKTCHIHRLALYPDYRKSGIARKLCEESFKECLNLGITRITVETPNSNIPAKIFYTKFGFRPLKGVELDNYLSQKGKEEQITPFSNDIEGRGAYFIEVKKLLRRLSE